MKSGVREGQDWFRKHQGDFSGQLLFDEKLARFTYYRIGGPAAILAVPKTESDIQWLAEGLRETGLPHFVLGNGSNLLVSEEGYSGLIVRANRLNLEMKEIPLSDGESRLILQTGGSVAISSLLGRAAQEGWAGLEFLTGIPGTVGGAIRMNAGTHLGETKDKLKRVEIYRLGGENRGRSSSIRETFEMDSLKFQYRKNLFLPSDALIWSADWEVQKAEPSQVKAVIDETLIRRKATQPLDYPSCGSVFKNPKASGISAWQVVDQLGLRGHRIGGAEFSNKHSNFILNLGNATATDVRDLIQLAKTRAELDLGLHLEEEVIYLGFG